MDLLFWQLAVLCMLWALSAAVCMPLRRWLPITLALSACILTGMLAARYTANTVWCSFSDAHVLRAGPREQYHMVAQLDARASVRVIAVQKNWACVQSAHKRGWLQLTEKKCI